MQGNRLRRRPVYTRKPTFMIERAMTLDRPLPPLTPSDIGGRCRVVTGHWPRILAEQQLSIATNAYSRPQPVTQVFQNQSLGFLLDHLVGAHEDRLGDLDAERFGGFEIDHKFDFGGLLHWKVGRLDTS